MTSLALCMIVKNESHIIRRCLQSVLPLLDYVLIVDTGSTDGTPQNIQEFLLEQQLPGEVIQEPWQDFAYNRSFALAKLREHVEIDYGLMIDADEVLVFEPDFVVADFKRQLTCDIYDVKTSYANISYFRPQLFRNHLPFCYRGKLHEFLDAPSECSRQVVKGFYNFPVQDSNRNHNPDKFRNDAKVLEKALLTETDGWLVARYTFYLAQSYRDCGELQLALTAYSSRAELGYWQEEVYISLLNIARIKEQLHYPQDNVIQAYLAAAEILPQRLEALHDAARYCRLQSKYLQAYILSQYGLQQSQPDTGLFQESWIYEYGLLDEFAIAAYWTGHFQESLDACLTLLKQPGLPVDYPARIRDNANFAINKLGKTSLAELLANA